MEDFSDISAVIGHIGSLHGTNRSGRVRKYSYQKIQEIETEIAYIEDRFRARTVKGKKRISTKLRHEQLKQELVELKAGHEEVARTLKVQAQKLQQLPREMMLAVLEKLYTQDKPIPIESRRIGDKILFVVSADESMYLSAMHVGELVASEAAKVFYKCSTFLFEPRTMPRKDQDGEEWLGQFFDTDHYKSGVIPRQFIRSLEVQLLHNLPPLFLDEMRAWYFHWGTFPRNDHFEADYDTIIRDQDRDIIYMPGGLWADALGSRQILSYIVTAQPDLRELRVNLDWLSPNGAGLLRLVNPIVSQALDQDIKVEVLSACYWPSLLDGSFDGSLGAPEQDDLIDLWKQPSETDYAIFSREAQRDVFEISDSSDPLDIWWKLETSAPGKLSHDLKALEDSLFKMEIYRVWLKEHFEVWRWRQANRRLINSFEDMDRDIQAAKEECLPDRVKYYLRLLKLRRPGVGG